MADHHENVSGGPGFGGVYLGPATNLIRTASSAAGTGTAPTTSDVSSPPPFTVGRQSLDARKSISPPMRASFKRRQTKDFQEVKGAPSYCSVDPQDLAAAAQ